MLVSVGMRSAAQPTSRWLSQAARNPSRPCSATIRAIAAWSIFTSRLVNYTGWLDVQGQVVGAEQIQLPFGTVSTYRIELTLQHQNARHGHVVAVNTVLA